MNGDGSDLVGAGGGWQKSLPSVLGTQWDDDSATRAAFLGRMMAQLEKWVGIHEEKSEGT